MDRTAIYVTKAYAVSLRAQCGNDLQASNKVLAHHIPFCHDGRIYQVILKSHEAGQGFFLHLTHRLVMMIICAQ